MKIVISPAKSLDFESELPTNKFTEAKFLSEAERLNKELEQRGFKVESIKYDEISKMGGLLRCSSMPLFRDRL